jgi:small GTP-binding protein
MDVIKKNIILLGDGATGKTSLVKRFVTDQFSDKYITTLGSKVTKKDVYLDLDGKTTHVILLVWDILGQKGYKYTQALSFGGIEGALLVSDVTRKNTLESLGDYWIPSLVSVTGTLPMIFLGNKCDLEGESEFSEAELEAVARAYEPCELAKQSYMTSALTGHNVEAAFRDLATSLIRVTDKAVLTYSQYIIDKTEIDGIKDVLDNIIADFITQFGGPENAGPMIEKQIRLAGLDVNQPTKKALVEFINALARIEEKFKPEKVVNLNRTKRLYLVNMI